ncbi:calcium-dependent phosphotriesterase [Byssothecium circinans]|uniref:Calcium-dependent phosphotriesterase n=1 Tax=Byssothecium circinans TaxID=147558 RepID=A0A6A5UCP4_9PLEO|nr:calcium-dependent phosphotriesterase [Byssothecium circinans]
MSSTLPGFINHPYWYSFSGATDISDLLNVVPVIFLTAYSMLQSLRPGPISASYVIFLAIVVPFFYDRYLTISHVLSHRAGKLQEVYNIKSHEILFRDRVRNCEDVLMEENLGIAILSCDPGRDRWNTVMGTFRNDLEIQSGALWLYDYSHPELPDSELLRPFTFKNFANADDFHPLGLELDVDTSTLYVVSHAQSGSCIEIFQLDVRSTTATHVRTFTHLLVQTPNSIHSLGDGKLFVTNDHYMRAAVSPLLSKIETFSAVPGGSVAYVDVKKPEESKVVARVPFANGITMLNKTTLAVGSTAKPGVYFYDVDPESHTLTFKRLVRTPVMVDNLSVDSKGVLLMAGHPDPFRLMQVSKGRPTCVEGSQDEEARKACECIAPSWAAEWSEERGLRTLYKSEEFCSSTMAVRDVERGVGVVSGLYERGIMVFKV